MLSIFLRDVALFFPHKICFEHVSTVLAPGSRVGIAGPNGSGKSTLLHMLRGAVSCSEGHIDVPPSVRGAYVPQTLPGEPNTSDACLSGGQRLYRAIGEALARNPDLLLLGDPRRTVLDVMRETVPDEDTAALAERFSLSQK